MPTEAVQEIEEQAVGETEANLAEPMHLAWDSLLDAEPLPAATDFLLPAACHLVTTRNNITRETL